MKPRAKLSTTKPSTVKPKTPNTATKPSIHTKTDSKTSRTPASGKTNIKGSTTTIKGSTPTKPTSKNLTAPKSSSIHSSIQDAKNITPSSTSHIPSPSISHSVPRSPYTTTSTPSNISMIQPSSPRPGSAQATNDIGRRDSISLKPISPPLDNLEPLPDMEFKSNRLPAQLILPPTPSPSIESNVSTSSPSPSIEVEDKNSIISQMKKINIEKKEKIKEQITIKDKELDKSQQKQDMINQKKIEIAETVKSGPLLNATREQREQIEQLQQTIKNLKEKNNQLQDANTDLTVNNEEVHNALEKLQNENNDLKDNMESIALLYQDSDNQNKELYDVIERMKEEMKINQAEWVNNLNLPQDEQEKVKLVKDNQELYELVEKFEEVIRTSNEQFLEKEQEYQDKIKEIPELKSQIDELNQLRPLIVQLSKINEELKEESNAFHDSETIIEKLTNKNLDLDDKNNELMMINEELEQLQDLHDEEMKTHIDLELKLNSRLNKITNDYNDMIKEVSQSRHLISEKDALIEQYREGLKVLGDKYNESEKESLELQETSDELQKKEKEMLQRNLNNLTKIKDLRLTHIKSLFYQLDGEILNQTHKYILCFIPKEIDLQTDILNIYQLFYRIEYKCNYIYQFFERWYWQTDFMLSENHPVLYFSIQLANYVLSILQKCVKCLYAYYFCEDSKELRNLNNGSSELFKVEKSLDLLFDNLGKDDISEVRIDSDIQLKLTESVSIFNTYLSDHISSSHLKKLYQKENNPLSGKLLKNHGYEMKLSLFTLKLTYYSIINHFQEFFDESKRTFTITSRMSEDEKKIVEIKNIEHKNSLEFTNLLKNTILDSWNGQITNIDFSIDKMKAFSDKIQKFHQEDDSGPRLLIDYNIFSQDFNNIFTTFSSLNKQFQEIHTELYAAIRSEESSLFTETFKTKINPILVPELNKDDKSIHEKSFIFLSENLDNKLQNLQKILEEHLSPLSPQAVFQSPKPFSPLWYREAEKVQTKISDSIVQLKEVQEDNQDLKKHLVRFEQRINEKQNMLTNYEERFKKLSSKFNDHAQMKEEAMLKNKTIQKMEKDIQNFKLIIDGYKEKEFSYLDNITTLKKKNEKRDSVQIDGYVDTETMRLYRNMILTQFHQIAKLKSQIHLWELNQLETTYPIPNIPELLMIHYQPLQPANKDRKKTVEDITKLNTKISSLNNKVHVLNYCPQVVDLNDKKCNIKMQFQNIQNNYLQVEREIHHQMKDIKHYNKLIEKRNMFQSARSYASIRGDHPQEILNTHNLYKQLQHGVPEIKTTDENSLSSSNLHVGRVSIPLPNNISPDVIKATEKSRIKVLLRTSELNSLHQQLLKIKNYN